MATITPLEFARRYFGEFMEKNSEIIPKLCPYCHGGSSMDKYTFAMNIHTGAFNCKRGSCGMSGTYNKIRLDFGESRNSIHYEFSSKQAKKSFTPSTVAIYPPGKKVIDYLAVRNINMETISRFEIGDDGNGNIAFPYIKVGKRVAVKYRPARKIEKGDQKIWRENGTDTTTLFGMQLVDESTKTLVVTEGEIDCLSMSEAGIPNAVSVPNGSQDFAWIEANWSWLEQFAVIYICGDCDEPGQLMVREVVKRLGHHRCAVVTLPEDCKDANEVLFRHGPEILMNAFTTAKEVPVAGILRLADVESLDVSKTERFKTGIYDLDRTTGGFFMGQLTVFTGGSGSGKSTAAGQWLLEGVEQGYSVCAFSGELPAPLFRYWVDLQAAGLEHIKYRHDPIFNSDRPYVPTDTATLIHNWYRNKFFLYDNATAITPDNLLSVFEYTAKRYDCRIFLVDNLMMLVGGSESDYYRAQSEFIKRCTAFARKFNVHVFVCAHPRKVTGRLTKLDVSGTADITNLADNVLSLYRLTPAEKASAPGNAILDVFKSRFSGQQDVHIGLCFDEGSKRFYQAGNKALLNRVYGWRCRGDGTYELPSEESVPF